jgi:hypothetical protein
MKRARATWPPGTWTWLLFAGFAALVHAFCGRIVAGHDILAALLLHRDIPVLLAAAALVIARLFLFLLVPGWALHIAVRAWLLRRAERAGRDP